jgi:2-polyprenyl-3-methyl-5-hydroxy-6-metoxy-1,4-benzoquinol methylase
MSANTRPDYLEVNRENWNRRADAHIHTEFYNQAAFMQGKSSLMDIERNLLGTIQGKKLLHLQCHFGQDTLSLARLGASVCGVDLSDRAIEEARNLAVQLNIPAQFICCDLYSLNQHLNEQFDIVFTSYGTIGWLPDIRAWAKVVSSYLKPGGIFIFAEFHPAMWMFDNDLQDVRYSYFKTEPIVEIDQGTYADKNSQNQYESITWNHGLAEVMQALLSEGLTLEVFQEFDYSPYQLSDLMEEFEPGKFRYTHMGNKLPLVYALRMSK